MYELDFYKITRLIKKGYVKDDQVVDKALLMKVGYMPKHSDGISLIANGNIDTPVKVCVDRASAKAKAMLEKAGGVLDVMK
jgi:ribosomal protein L15